MAVLGSVRRDSGFTVIEFLIAAAIFVMILGAMGALLVSSSRAYNVTTTRSEAIQDSESVLQLMRYEVALAGYRGLTETNYLRPFTLVGGATGDRTIIVRRTPDGDELVVRYFEDRYLGGGDTGERSVTFRVDDVENTLVRVETRPGGGGATTSTELLVGNILGMEIVEVVDRWRNRYPVTSILGGATPPEQIAGLNIVIRFTDSPDWEFLIGVPNPQSYLVTAGGS